MLCCIILHCMAYSERESMSPIVSKNRKIPAKVLSGFVWEMEAPGDGLLK